MDYVVGGVAALLSGNVTPNRPKKLKKPLTPIKHQQSPNVTPKSEFVEDRSIFLSPTMQKKKGIAKKSPKRIFQNPELDVTNDEGNSSLSSPNADKVKKHLKDKLDTTPVTEEVLLSPKSPKENKKMDKKENVKSKKKLINSEENTTEEIRENQLASPKKKKQKNSFIVEDIIDEISSKDDHEKENTIHNEEPQNGTLKKKRKRSKSAAEPVEKAEIEPNQVPEQSVFQTEKKKNKKKKNKTQQNTKSEDVDETNKLSPKKKNKKKNKSQANEYVNIKINPNAVTNKDTDSEHESDDEMESENEEENSKTQDGEAESSEEEEEVKKKEAPKEAKGGNVENKVDKDEIKRTLFVGNVPFSTKCKKEIKKIFSQYGDIDTVRIRTIPVKDARTTPKLAVIKSELHPDRSTVNVYVKFADEASVEKALAANNTVLNDHHLRVSRSDSTGVIHDPKCAVFVGNLPFALEDETLREKFAKCGEIESVRIVRDRKTLVGKGFGYVNFASKDGVELALALTEEDLTIKNRIIRVKRCMQLTKGRDNNKAFNQSKQSFNQRKEPFNQRKEPFNQRKDMERRPFGRDNQFKGRFNKDDKNEGAYRRVMNKRKNQDGGEGPPNKKQNLNQPNKEKKVRKEFVGMTAEKKKKHKFDKGQKKKKALSEILTK